MKSILVVDDNKTNLSAALSVLSGTYKVMPVTSGAQALKFLEKGSCDLILLDINMPDMDGFEVLKKIKQDRSISGIPVIFLTADTEAETEISCLEAGAMDFITKPFIPAVMRSRIERIFELEDMRRQLADRPGKKIREVSEIKSRSRQDPLTGLWNRAYTENAVNALLSEGGTGALFMIDMDNFKAINDNYGHIEGDNTLKMFAETMRKFSSGGDILCRIGGDKFVMFINGSVSKSSLGRLAGDIISDLCAKLEEKELSTNSSVSIGIARIPEDGRDFSSVYNAADKALYYVKQNGKKSYYFFSEQKEQETARSSTLADLKYLKEIMSRADSGKGVYRLDLDAFRNIYNFMQRFAERSGKEVQTVLFTVSSEGGDQSETEEALEMLEQAIYDSLRRVDISTRYSGKQIIVILLEADSESSDMVAKRIIEAFENIYTGNRVSISYDIAKMESKAESLQDKNNPLH